MKKRAVILGGGSLNESFVLDFLKTSHYDLLVAADAGLSFLRTHGIYPTHIVGDFDSADETSLAFYRDTKSVEIVQFQPEKDWTDTEIAAELALTKGCEELTVLGATGGRLDHTLGNIQLLALIKERGADGFLLDPQNRVYLRDHSFTVEKDRQWGKYLSLFAYGGEVKDLTLTGVKYPLDRFRLGNIGTRTVSNEITSDQAVISFSSGKLLVVESKEDCG